MPGHRLGCTNILVMSNNSTDSGHGLDQVRICVQLASVLQASGPGKDAGDGVGAGGFPLRTTNTD